MLSFYRQASESLSVRMRLLVAEIAHEYDFANFTLSSFVDWMSLKRERRITCLEVPLPEGQFGLWIDLDGQDIVACNANTIPIHKSHIFLHELSHILCNHSTLSLDLTDPNGFQPEWLRSQSGRFRYTHAPKEEKEAETLALLLKERIMRHRSASKLSDLSSSDVELATFFELMELD